jgi:hypothetical protein
MEAARSRRFCGASGWALILSAVDLVGPGADFHGPLALGLVVGGPPPGAFGLGRGVVRQQPFVDGVIGDVAVVKIPG